LNYPKYVTIEPIMEFDFEKLVKFIQMCDPVQVNIGADTSGSKLPEPTSDEIHDLIINLSEFTTVKLKKNLKRIYSG